MSWTLGVAVAAFAVGLPVVAYLSYRAGKELGRQAQEVRADG